MAKKGTHTDNAHGRVCPVCRESHHVNYILREKHWYCLQCDTEFDREGVIYVYDEKGELVELIADKPNIWDKMSIGKTKQNLILTNTG